jgi:hypothetical protein
MPQAEIPAIVWGVVAVALLYVGVAIAGKGDPLYLVRGADGRLSTSKFQLTIWTTVNIFSFVFLYVIHAVSTKSGQMIESMDQYPTNLMIAMGFVVTAAAGAKGITVSLAQAGRQTKVVDSSGGGLGNLVADDRGIPDLTKIQLVAWTIIAVVVYLGRVFSAAAPFAACSFASGAAIGCSYPDIDGPLMVLMGLSNGTYLGAKLTPTLPNATAEN